MASKHNILFVDDDQNVLDGFRRMLRSMQHEWDMNFVNCGQEALSLIAKKNFRVILSRPGVACTAVVGVPPAAEEP